MWIGCALFSMWSPKGPTMLSESTRNVSKIEYQSLAQMCPRKCVDVLIFVAVVEKVDVLEIQYPNDISLTCRRFGRLYKSVNKSCQKPPKIHSKSNPEAFEREARKNDANKHPQVLKITENGHPKGTPLGTQRRPKSRQQIKVCLRNQTSILL